LLGSLIVRLSLRASRASRTKRFTFAAAVGCALLVGAPSLAHADAESDAKDLFERGREMRKQGDCTGAVPLFRKAYAIYPKGLGTLRNVAECEEQLGHWASSRRAWLDLKRALIAEPTPDPKYDGWQKEAEDAAARLAPKVATVYVDVTVKSPEGEGPANEKSGVELLVNGESLGTKLVGTPLERDPGVYRIRVQAPDAPHPVEQTISLAAGDSKHIRLELVRNGPPKVAGPDHGGGIIEPPDVVRDDAKGRRTVGYIVGGIGLAALVGGGVTLLLRSSAKSDLDDACNGNVDACPESKRSDAESIESRGKTMSTLTTALGIGGAVCLVGGIALVLTAPSPSKTGTLTVRPGLAGGDVTWRF
jgi:hypothetical protein